MTEEEEVMPVNPSIVFNYATYIERLNNHLEKSSPEVQETVDLLGKLEPFVNVEGFSSIGEGAKNWKDGLMNTYDMKTTFGLSNTLNDDDKKKLKQAVQTWRVRGSDTIGEVFSVTPETRLSEEDLNQGPEAFLDLPNSTIEEYPDVVKDLQEACACVLVGTYTAAEFMSLRATESVLRQWHSSEVDDDTNYDGWYNAIEDLGGEEINQGPKELSLLNYLRSRRNEVAHPDRHSNQSDAERTLQNVFEVVEQLIEDIESGSE